MRRLLACILVFEACCCAQSPNPKPNAPVPDLIPPPLQLPGPPVSAKAGTPTEAAQATKPKALVKCKTLAACQARATLLQKDTDAALNGWRQATDERDKL